MKTPAKGKSKKVESKEDLIQYIRQLDRLRWEFLRLSDTYRKDWQQFLDEHIFDEDLDIKILCEQCESWHSTECADCEKMQDFWENRSAYIPIYAFRKNWDLDSYYRSLNDKSRDVLMKYGIRFFAEPDLSYEEVMSGIMEEPESLYFTPKDFNDFDAFVKKFLESGDSLSEHIRNNLTDDVLGPIKTYVNKEPLRVGNKLKKRAKMSKKEKEQEKTIIQEAVCKILNTILDDYELRNRTAIELSEKAQKLIPLYSLNRMHRHCNRILFDEVYKDLIVNSYENPEERWYDRFIFYTYLHEYSIFEGVYPSMKAEDSPFITLTVNITSPVEASVDEYRKIISAKRKEFYRREDKNIHRKKWSLPNGANFGVLEKKLNLYRLCKTLEAKNKHVSIEGIKKEYFRLETNYDFDETTDKLLEDIDNRNLPKDKREKANNLFRRLDMKKDKIDSKVEEYLQYINNIVINVEQGIFP